MVFLYGYSLLYILSGIFAYSLNFYQVFMIALIAYSIDKFTFKTIKRFMTIAITIIVLLGSGVYLLYRMEQLESVWLTLVEFLTVYYYSITVATVAIDAFHQIILLLFIGLMIMAPLDKIIRIDRKNYLYLAGATVLLVIVGYLTRTLGSSKDREAFLIISATLIVYYFYNFYYRFSDFKRKFLPFFTTITVFLLIIVAGSRILYAVDPRPLTQTARRTTFTLSEDVESEISERDKLNYFRDETFTVSDSFEYNYIEILRIRSEEVSYLKSETYESYDDGQWTKTEELPYLVNDGDAIHKSNAFDQVKYKDYYTIEDVQVVVKNFNTNVLLVNNYAVLDTVFYDNIRVMNDTRRGTFFSNDRLEKDYVYEFNAIIPNYGSRIFDDFVREHSNNRQPAGLEQMSSPLSDSYSAISVLAATITEGIDNKYDQALAIENYLHENYVYSETPLVPPDDVDPIMYFLFESKEGFCQQFSTAFILMLRSLDIPSRYAVGFYVGERIIDPSDVREIYELEELGEGVYKVFDSNAHTWPEVYFPEVGWIMFEPTPGRYYKEDYVDYNPYDFDENQTDKPDTIAMNIDPSILYITMSITILLMTGFGIYAMVNRRHKLKQILVSDKMLTIHQLIRRYYRAAGLRKENYETAREFARRMDASMYEIKGGTMTALMEDYEKVLYGGAELDEQSLITHFEYLKEVRRVMKKRLIKVQVLRMRLIEYFTLNL